MANTSDSIQDILAEILKNMGVGFRGFKVIEEKNRTTGTLVYRIDIASDEASSLIGYHGETVYALQHVLKTIVWKRLGESIFVILDVDGYRKRQEDSVLALAMRKVELARTTLQDQTLPPMSSYFRRIIHLALAKPDFSDITTESTGEGEKRAVVIKVKNEGSNI